MTHLVLRNLCYFGAARAVVRPYPGWHLGVGESNGRGFQDFRKRLWGKIKTPALIPWLNDLRVYVYPGNETSRALFLTGYYEPNEFFYLEKVLKPGMTFLDVGANIGLYTLFAARKVGPQGRVVAVEPSRRDFTRLRANVELNRLTNVRLLQVAASNSTGEADLLIATEEKSGHNSLGAFGYESVVAQGKERVRVVKLDDIVHEEKLETIDLMKMDIEGAELWALHGSVAILEQFHPVVLLELSDRTLRHQGCRSGEVWEFLEQHGYRIYTFNPDTGAPVPAQIRLHFDSDNIIAVHPLSVGQGVGRY